MKYLALIIFATVSQLTFSQKMSVGPEIGLNIIQIENEQIGRDYQLGLYAGGVFEYEFANWFSLRTGLNYTQTRQQEFDYDTSAFELFGFTLDPSTFPGIDLSTYTKTTSRQSQSYFQLPIMGSFKWKDFNFSVGGYLGLMFAAYRKNKIVSDTPFLNVIDIESMDSTGILQGFFPKPHEERFEETSDKESLNAFDYGLKASIGYQMKEFGVNVSYSYGLSDYRKVYQELRTHKYVQLSIRYMFKIGEPGQRSRIP